MRILNLISSVLILLVTNSCDDRKMMQATSMTNTEPDQQSADHQFNGEWVFVGLAHPWHQGDIFGWAGCVVIQGEDIRVNFVRSPSSARPGVNGPGPFFIPEGDQDRAAINYSGKLVSTTADFRGQPGWIIHGTCFDQLLLWDQYGSEPDALYIGDFDPPLMFKRVGAHPIYASDEEDSEDEESPPSDTVREYDDPFDTE